MRGDDGIYGVIAEYKDDAAIIHECPPLTWQQAYDRMKELVKRPDVIRVAMFEAVYAYGNKSLLPEKGK